MKHYKKKVRNPFFIDLDAPDITFYTDVYAAAFFNNAYLFSVLESIRHASKGSISNEDNEIQVFIRIVGPSLFRVTYQLNESEGVKALMFEYDSAHNFRVYSDPLL